MDIGRNFRGLHMCAATGVFTSAPAQDLISNLTTEMRDIEVGGEHLPLTVNDGAPTCYICCPSVAYLDYAEDELRHFKARPWLKWVLRGLIGAARPLLRCSGFDRQVQPNNWLVSTNIVPDLTAEQIAGVTESLVKQWPGHVVLWRSFNDLCHGQLLQRFKACGYSALPSRQIYIFDARGDAPTVHRDEARDRRLLDRTDYRVVGPDEIGPADFERMAWLYQKLYLDKYTRLNPRYTPLFMQWAHQSGMLSFHGLRNGGGVLDGVIGFFEQGDTLTAPIVGYDTGQPAEVGLYRRLMAMALLRARDRRMLYNMSAGAAAFKRYRGGVAAVEYSIVYNRHLGLDQRAAGRCVRAVLDTVGVAVLKGLAL